MEEVKRRMEGERKVGGDRQSIHHRVVEVKGWTQDKTAEKLTLFWLFVGTGGYVRQRAIANYPLPSPLSRF